MKRSDETRRARVCVCALRLSSAPCGAPRGPASSNFEHRLGRRFDSTNLLSKYLSGMTFGVFDARAVLRVGHRVLCPRTPMVVLIFLGGLLGDILPQVSIQKYFTYPVVSPCPVCFTVPDGGARSGTTATFSSRLVLLHEPAPHHPPAPPTFHLPAPLRREAGGAVFSVSSVSGRNRPIPSHFPNRHPSLSLPSDFQPSLPLPHHYEFRYFGVTVCTFGLWHM